MTPSRTIAVFFFLTVCVVHVSADAAVDAICEDVQIQTCDACIQAHPNCAWCLKSQSDNANIKRCRAKDQFDSEKTCADGMLQNPSSTTSTPKNELLSEVGIKQDGATKVVQLKPQKIHLELRKGGVQKFNITFRKVSDYPVDLYYVMDLSFSMRDDLLTLQKLGTRLAEDIQSNVTQDIQLGFGTFVDKVMMPFASTVPAQLENPCFKNQEGGTCAPPFGFKHQQKISDDLEAFKNAVTNTQISGNIDSPEGGFDALMQIAVCTGQIGWRDESTHLVVFTTDASFHMALDGKLAAILEMNDLGCHLEKGANAYLKEDIVYSMSKEQDYPSIGQLRHVFNKYKIQPIFAVTEEVKPLYDGLKELIPNSHVDQLAADSSNIIGIIKDAYNNLKGNLEMTWTGKPKEVAMKYRTLCPGESGWKDQSLRCVNITIGSEVVYEFEMTATECLNGAELPPMTFTSSSLQESVEITFSFKCGCDCTDQPVSESSECNGNGSLVCGVCQCDSQHEGAKCQCVRESTNVALIDSCKKDGVGDEVCEGNGVCECGDCKCNTDFSGTYCQCSNKGCPKDLEGETCGGPDKGVCLNCNHDLKCQCRNGYTLHEVINTCTCHEKECINRDSNDTLVCSGRGVCDCSECICNETGVWKGEFCQVCMHPKCKGGPQDCDGGKYVTCAVCVNKAQSLGKNVKDECEEACEGVAETTIVSEIPDCNNCEGNEGCVRVCDRLNTNVSLPMDCATPLPQSECDIKYLVVWFTDKDDFGIVVKEYNKDTDCRKPVNIIYIVLPIVAGIMILGLIALAIWKAYQTMRDKKEWENFEKEMKQSKWTKGQNPIFEKPLTNFKNPTYQGN